MYSVPHAKLKYCKQDIPVRIAAGMISPKKSTSVTDIRIAKYSLTKPERKIGRASVAAAFHSMSVTSRR